jgi:hypothetical protein
MLKCMCRCALRTQEGVLRTEAEIKALYQSQEEIIKRALTRKNQNSVCANCGNTKKILLPHATLMLLATEMETQNYEVTFSVVCTQCGTVISYLSRILLDETDRNELAKIAEQLKAIQEKKEG